VAEASEKHADCRTINACCCWRNVTWIDRMDRMKRGRQKKQCRRTAKAWRGAPWLNVEDAEEEEETERGGKRRRGTRMGGGAMSPSQAK
jgi:hypothetical protein